MKFIKHIAGFFAFAAIAGVLAAGGFAWWGMQEFKKERLVQPPVMFEVERGMALGQVAHALADEKIIEQPLLFIAGARLMKAQSDIKAGEYQFFGALSAHDVLNMLREGKTFQRNFTIPEGLTSYEIVQIINGVEELSGEIGSIPAEGALLPETYDYRSGEDRQDIVNRLQGEMTKAIDELWPMRADGLPVKTKEEALILASIIEKETGEPDERKRVAGVFVNRLKKGMLLQTDPTVIYALHQGKPHNQGKGPIGRRLLRKDLEIDSPYNTYKYAGLPPGPIANPGRASIEAALNPEIHDYVYFVADGTGGHLFAKTLAEHNRNVANWRKIRRAQ